MKNTPNGVPVHGSREEIDGLRRQLAPGEYRRHVKVQNAFHQGESPLYHAVHVWVQNHGPTPGELDVYVSAGADENTAVHAWVLSHLVGIYGPDAYVRALAVQRAAENSMIKGREQHPAFTLQDLQVFVSYLAATNYIIADRTKHLKK